MKCSKVQKQFVELKNRDLPEEIARHLEQCSTCKREYERALRLCQLLSLKQYETPPPETNERRVLSIRRGIQETLNAQSDDNRVSPWEWITLDPLHVLRYAAAAVLIAIVGIHLFVMPTLQPGTDFLTSVSPEIQSIKSPATHTVSSRQFDRYADLKTSFGMTNGQSADIQYGPLRSTVADYEY